MDLSKTQERLRKAREALEEVMKGLDPSEESEEDDPAAREEEARNRKEQEERRKAELLKEKLEKRANTIAGCLRRFLAASEAIREDERRQRKEELLAAQSKKGKKKGKKKKGKKNAGPLADAWKALLDDLDEKINKQKRCANDDIYRGVMSLSEQEHKMLYAVMVTTSPKAFPPKQMNEVMVGIKNVLFQSAAARDYRIPKIPEAGHKGAHRTTRALGFPAITALNLGFGVHEMVSAGYTALELRECGAIIHDKLKEAGIA